MTPKPQHRKPRPGFPVAARGWARRGGSGSAGGMGWPRLASAGAPFEAGRRPEALGRCMAKVRHLLRAPRQRCTHNQIA